MAVTFDRERRGVGGGGRAVGGRARVVADVAGVDGADHEQAHALRQLHDRHAARHGRIFAGEAP